MYYEPSSFLHEVNHRVHPGYDFILTETSNETQPSGHLKFSKIEIKILTLINLICSFGKLRKIN